MATLETIPFPKNSEEWEQFKKKVNSLKNKANNRLKRLEKNKLENTPAYKAFTTYHGEPRFGIKGKTNREVRAEYFKIKHFLEASTSTVKGAQKYLDRELDITKMAVNANSIDDKILRVALKSGETYQQQVKINGLIQLTKSDKVKAFWKIADDLRKSMTAANSKYLALDSERVINSVRMIIDEQNRGANEINDMGDILLEAWSTLEQQLNTSVNDKVLDYIEKYAETNFDKSITINF